MSTQPPRFSFNTNKIPIFGIMIALLYALATGSGMAAPKVCKKNCPPLPQSPENYVFWGFDVTLSKIYDDQYRVCNLAQIAPDFSSGTYDCLLNTHIVKYDLSTMPSVSIYTKGDETLCASNSQIFAAPNLQFSYSWTGNCVDGCDVSIVNRMDLGPLSGSMTIEAFTHVQTPGMNPFTEQLDMNVDLLQVTKFAAKGKDKVLAICELTPGSGVTFHTYLDPVTPD